MTPLLEINLTGVCSESERVRACMCQVESSMARVFELALESIDLSPSCVRRDMLDLVSCMHSSLGRSVS